MKLSPMRIVHFVVCAVVAAVVVTAAGPVSAQTNYIANGDFSQGLTSWVPYISDPPGPANTISVVFDAGNPVLQMSVSALEGSGTDWHVQTWQPDGALDTLASSTLYTLSFRAKASAVRTMHMDLYQWEYDPPVPYRYLGMRVWPTIGTTWQTYSINFRTEDNMPNYPDAKVKLSFAVGHQLGTVWLDDIRLEAAPVKTFAGTNLQLFAFEPSESWLTGSIQNSPTPPDVAPSDAAHVHEGTAALKLAAGTSGKGYAERQAPLDLSVDNWEMTFWAYVDNPANVANVSVALRSGSDSQLALKWWAHTGFVAGWNQIVIPKTQFFGVFWRERLSWPAVRVVGLKLEANDNGPANVWIDDLRVEPAAGDRRPPVISEVNLESLSPTAVTVGWKIDEAATGRLDCGTTTSYGSATTSGVLSTSHSLILTNLAANTLYHCQVSSDDAGARTGRTGDFVFRTDPSTPWVPADPLGTFQVGLFGVPGWDNTGAFNLAFLNDPFLTRFTRFYGADQTWETDAQLVQYLDIMEAHGRKAFVNIVNPAILSGDTATIQARVNAIKGHAALAGWYLFDEPEYYSVTPQQLDTAYQAIKQADPVHPITFAAPGFGPSYPFLSAMDYGILDPYPIPYDPPSAILTNLAQATAAGKAYDYTIQAYQSDMNLHWPGDVPGPTRFPSREETRSLAYLAMNHGTTNLLFYGFWESHVVPGVTWEWMKTVDVGNELIRLGPIYSSTDIPQISFVSSSSPDLDAGVRQWQGKAYATVVNKSASQFSATLTFSGWVIQSAKEVAGQRAVSSTATAVTDTWPGYGVNVYELTIAIQAPTNLVGTALAGRVNRLTWTDNAANESGFEVQRALKSGSTCGTYATIATPPAASGTGSTVTYNDVGSGNNPPLSNKTYCYRARTRHAQSQSTWAGPVSVKTRN